MPVIAFELRCAADLECLDLVQDTLAELWKAAEKDSTATAEAGVGDIDRMLFETALVEILGNIVEHGRTPEGATVEVVVQLEVHDDRVVAVLRDDGVEPPVDLAGASLPKDELAEDGRGFALAGAVAEVTHSYDAGGNTWRVVRHRTA
jgi:serine/threonine-protein kinase RsbW